MCTPKAPKTLPLPHAPLQFTPVTRKGGTRVSRVYSGFNSSICAVSLFYILVRGTGSVWRLPQGACLGIACSLGACVCVVGSRLLDRGGHLHRRVDTLHCSGEGPHGEGSCGGCLVHGGSERCEVWNFLRNFLWGCRGRMVGCGSPDSVYEHRVLGCARCREEGRVGRRSWAGSKIRMIRLGTRGAWVVAWAILRSGWGPIRRSGRGCQHLGLVDRKEQWVLLESWIILSI